MGSPLLSKLLAETISSRAAITTGQKFFATTHCCSTMTISPLSRAKIPLPKQPRPQKNPYPNASRSSTFAASSQRHQIRPERIQDRQAPDIGAKLVSFIRNNINSSSSNNQLSPRVSVFPQDHSVATHCITKSITYKLRSSHENLYSKSGLWLCTEASSILLLHRSGWPETK